MRRTSRSEFERFWEKVDTNGPIPQHCPALGPCWIYTGPQANGYGRFTRSGGAQVGAHRFAYALAYGPAEAQVLHKCDNRRCVRPSHLLDGTQLDNMRDMAAKGRDYRGDQRGVRNGRAKLYEAEVLEIRARYAAGETNKSALADDYGVSNPLIGMIVRREAWKHI